jgi:TolB-like protein/DNA-binding winged helix-turn-helix (wHTH) protein/tetratricopeptide (TPR) repeat protein/rhodanese-related sulfurtransferase
MNSAAQEAVYRFGSFTLDLRRGALLATDGAEISLRPKPFALLEMLVENAGRLLSREAILAAVWPNVYVTDDNITKAIHDIRGALGDDAYKILRTVPRRGYIFAPIVNVPSTAEELAHAGVSGSPLHGTLRSAEDQNLGHRLAERRQLTVMVCDVVASTQLSGRLDLDDLHEVTIAYHRCCADIIERYHGYVANYSTDRVLAYFGYSRADEHDVERAIRAGLALVEAIPKLNTAARAPLHVGLGIATGMVVGGDPSGCSTTNTISAVGSTPNFAARLQSLAAADQILITASTRQLIGSIFELADLGEHDLKGVTEPVHVWRVERVPRSNERTRTPDQAAPRLSIVVLPFENLSSDSKDDYLADGVTDDLTTDLCRVPGLFVIARTSASSYKGKPEDPRKIGEELGVRYLLEGSIRKLGGAVRVNAQLIATETGVHLWAERFDQQLTDLSAGQEEIVQRIGMTLNVALTDIESARSKRERPTEPDAFDLILRARSIGMHPMGPRETAAALALYEQALRLDPAAVLAMMGIAIMLIETGRKGDELDRVAGLIKEAAAIDPNHLLVLSNTGYLLAAQHRFAEAILAYQRMLDYYPNYTAGYANIGRYLIFAGRLEEAIRMIEMSIRRDPRTAYLSHRTSDIGFALLLLGRYEEAIVWTQRALVAGPPLAAGRFVQNYLRIAAAQAKLGHFDEAHRALAEANRIWPYDTVRSRGPEDLSSPLHAAQIERLQAELRLAGHRDHADEDADFGVVSDDKLHQDDYSLAGQTPTTAPGAQTIRTAELVRLIAERKPIVIDPLEYFWGRSIPGAVGLKFAGWGSSVADGMQELTSGDLNKPIVAVGWNAERFDGRNLALRLVALGYTRVYWYRGGREAWEVNGLPQTELAATPW